MNKRGTHTRDMVLSIVLVVLGAVFLVVFGGGSLLLLAFGLGVGDDFRPLLLGLARVGIVPSALGLSLLVCGLIGQRRVRYRREYAARLLHDPRHSVLTLAERLNLPEQTVIKRVTLMLHKGYFPGGYLEKSTGCVILPAPEQTAPAAARAQYHVGRPDGLFHVQVERSSEAPAERRVQCAGCGAEQLISGRAALCPYCGQVAEGE